MKKTKLFSLLFVLSLLVGCSGNPGGNGGTDEPDGFEFDEDALAEVQEIHTADQKAYLNFSGDYYKIKSSDLTSFNANGNSDVSAPKPVTISWDFGSADKEVDYFSLVYGLKEDLSDGYEVKGTAEKSISFYNAYLGDNYFKVIANFTDGTTEESEIGTFKVDEQAPRNLKVGNMPNCRDMGGRTTYAGGKIRQGMIYRTAGNKFDNRSDVNQECRDVLLKQLKVKTEINVANGTGNNVNLGNGVTVKDCFMDYGATPYSNLSRNAERVRQVMDILADETNYPVFYHCRIGTDRTGITGMMIGGLLGIPFNEIFQDYCFSNFAPIDGQRYPNKESDPNGDDPAKYIDEIKLMPGKNYQEQTYNALLSMGCSTTTLNKIIDIMTVGPKADIPVGKVGIGTGLTTTVSKSTASDYKNPNVYYAINNGKEISFTTTLTAGQKDVVVYLGSTNSSSSDKLSGGITLKIDGEEKTIVDKTLFKAGFGQTQQNKRTGYMFNILGKYDLTAGEHTFTIAGKSSTTFNIGTICVFDHVAPTA